MNTNKYSRQKNSKNRHYSKCKNSHFDNAYHCVKSVRIWNFSDSYSPAFGLNTERYGVSQRFSPYSVRMRENMDQKKFKYGHFSRSVYVAHKQHLSNILSSIKKNLLLVKKACNLLVHGKQKAKGQGRGRASEAYSEPCQTSKMEWFLTAKSR